MSTSQTNILTATMIAVLLGIRLFTLGIGFSSLLLSVLIFFFLIPALDSLSGNGTVRRWDRNTYRWTLTHRQQEPFLYWFSLISSWPFTIVFAYLLLRVPRLQ